MDERRTRTLQVNARVRVTLMCTAHSITSREEIQQLTQRVIHDITNKIETEQIKEENFESVFNERMAQLENELTSGIQPTAITDFDSSIPDSSFDFESSEIQLDPLEQLDHIEPTELYDEIDLSTDSTLGPIEPIPIEEEKEEDKPIEPPKKRIAGDYTEKLQNDRKPLRTLIDTDCVYLGLVDKDRARELITQMPGKDPREAEKEVVSELRNNLYDQIRKFMKKHKGGPWQTVKEQHELMLDIKHTPSVHSLIRLTQQLLKDQQEWLNSNKKSLTRTLLGGTVRFK